MGRRRDYDAVFTVCGSAVFDPSEVLVDVELVVKPARGWHARKETRELALQALQRTDFALRHGEEALRLYGLKSTDQWAEELVANVERMNCIRAIGQ